MAVVGTTHSVMLLGVLSLRGQNWLSDLVGWRSGVPITYYIITSTSPIVSPLSCSASILAYTSNEIDGVV